MSRRKRFHQPFDRRGSVVVVGIHLLKSRQFLSLMSQAKVLMLLLLQHWRSDKPVAYGIREAAEKIPCDRRTAMKAFDQLMERGFVTMVDYSTFCSRTESKSRTWKLEWMPFNDKPPSNLWEEDRQ